MIKKIRNFNINMILILVIMILINDVLICSIYINNKPTLNIEGNTLNHNYWSNKKIVWFGTSIPAGGYSGLETMDNYPNMVGEILGANVINESIGSSPMHCQRASRVSTDNPYGFDENWTACSRCLSNSLEEMQWLIDNYDSPIFTNNTVHEITPELKEKIFDCSYERKLNRHLGTKRADLYVLDHGYNDRMIEENQYSEIDPYNKQTFKGAANFIIKKILDDNPRAKIAIVTHNNNQCLEKYNEGVIEAQEGLASDWQLPCCQLYKRLGWSSKNTIATTKKWNSEGYLVDAGKMQQATVYSLWIQDGVHPHSDKSKMAMRYIAENLAAWLEHEVR
ncbi:MAG: hypothetical protein E7251_01175 [Paenibacillaceae bacterium]|nr:hypothetical protein [Paenibacillaceae bacterium]